MGSSRLHCLRTGPARIIAVAVLLNVLLLLKLFGSTLRPPGEYHPVPPSRSSTVKRQDARIEEMRALIDEQDNAAASDVAGAVKAWAKALEERDNLISDLYKRAQTQEETLAKLRAKLGTQRDRARKNPSASSGSLPADSARGAASTFLSSSPASSCDISWTAPASLEKHFFSAGVTSPSAPVPQSECIKHPELLATRCYINDLTVKPSLIDVTYGGEKMSSVMGRVEDGEYAKYKLGSFSSPQRDMLPHDHDPHRWYLNKVLKGMVAGATDPSMTCNETPTLFITRYEYVNLFHTMTDWYNVFEAVPMSFWGDEGASVNIIWLDGHAEGNLDEVWAASFGETR